jgi:hypothetical protein
MIYWRLFPKIGASDKETASAVLLPTPRLGPQRISSAVIDTVKTVV